MKRSMRILLSFTIFSLTVLSIFQNCSQAGSIAVSDPLAAQKAADAERLAMGADDEMVTVGMNQVPDLKLFFVVDNSGTMQKNQFNLAESFGSMFAPGFSSSLSKFDATTFITSTAQKSNSYATEKTALDSIVAEQKNFSLALSLPMAQFTALARDASYNYGYLPGDNIGYDVVMSSNPVKYDFTPAMVLGQSVDASNNVTFKPSIRKLASEDSSVMETEFKNRISILNSDRIPLVKVGSNYSPMHNDVVDAESGLCAVARVLRNPENYFKSGDMVSFTIVSDENDNDPQGLNCIQNVTELTGNEDLVDGECRQRSSAISYQTVLTSKTADTCKLNGFSGYNFRFNYVNNKITTDVTYKIISTPAKYTANYSDITYKVVKTPAQYKANYSDLTYQVLKAPAQYLAPYTQLTYKVNQYSYQYLYTKVTYYTQTCADVVSDGLVIGQKCNVVTPAVTGTKDGNYTGDCYGLAKSLNAAAINSDGYKPVCSTDYRAIASCSASDTSCKQNATLVDKVVATPFLGVLDSNACLAQAKTYSDYVAGTTPVCKDVSKTVSACSVAETAAGCKISVAATYQNKTVAGLIGTFTAAQCLAKAQSYADYVAGPTPTCVLNPKTVGSCSAAEVTAGCSLNSDVVYGTKTVNVVGVFDATNCETKAKTFSDYVAGGTSTCVANNKAVTTCSAAEVTAGCTQTTPPVYGSKTTSASGDLTTTQDACYNFAKTQSGNAVGATGDVTGCKKVVTAQNLVYDSVLNFSEYSSAVDGGVLLTSGSDCGVMKSAALAKAQKTIPQLASTDTCTITAVNKAVESVVETLSADCTPAAVDRCTTQNLRGCTGAYVAGTASNKTSDVTLFKKVNEDIKCASSCKSSVMGICGDDKDSDITVADYLKKIYGNTASCIESTQDVAGSAVTQIAAMVSNEAKICKPNLAGVPSYFVETSAIYRTKTPQVDYVSGTVKDAGGNNVPKSSLVDYIKERSQSLSNGTMTFSALARTSTDPLGYGGSYGVDYEKLITQTHGRFGSVLSSDYSLMLQDLSGVLKSSLERTFVLKKMKPSQIIKQVSQVKANGQVVVIDVRLWTQNGATVVFSNSLEINDGDQFKIDFANY